MEVLTLQLLLQYYQKKNLKNTFSINFGEKYLDEKNFKLMLLKLQVETQMFINKQ